MSDRPRLKTLPRYGDTWRNDQGVSLYITGFADLRAIGRIWTAQNESTRWSGFVTEDGLAEAGYWLESRLDADE